MNGGEGRSVEKKKNGGNEKNTFIKNLLCDQTLC